mmetsp:Transcript_12361/g.22904  ORF Transcript_12361/g.22904 Transcript_12361/m.22904 type:complete len:327 (-) Transcript_12361:245-1225(-)
MALSMHAGYNKNENTLEKEKNGDQSKILVGNWTEERALLEMADHTRMPPSRKHYAGSARTLQHRDEEKPCDYRSSLRSTFVNPEEHSNFFPSEGSSVVGRREQARMQQFRNVAEVEALEREAEKGRIKAAGSYDPSSSDAQRHHGEDIYKEQKATGKFVKSNKFINEMVKLRTDVECPQAPPEMPYHEGTAITKFSWDASGSGHLRTNFKVLENPLDYWPSDVWGHGKRGCLPEARGTGDGPGYRPTLRDRRPDDYVPDSYGLLKKENFPFVQSSSAIGNHGSFHASVRATPGAQQDKNTGTHGGTFYERARGTGVKNEEHPEARC